MCAQYASITCGDAVVAAPDHEVAREPAHRAHLADADVLGVRGEVPARTGTRGSTGSARATSAGSARSGRPAASACSGVWPSNDRMRAEIDAGEVGHRLLALSLQSPHLRTR